MMITLVEAYFNQMYIGQGEGEQIARKNFVFVFWWLMTKLDLQRLWLSSSVSPE